MAAKKGDPLIALVAQPAYSGPHKGDNHSDVGMTEGLQVFVEKTTVEKATGVHRMLVAFVDDKEKPHKGWVRMNDTKHRYFEFADGRGEEPIKFSQPAEASPAPQTIQPAGGGPVMATFEVEDDRGSADQVSNPLAVDADGNTLPTVVPASLFHTPFKALGVSGGTAAFFTVEYATPVNNVCKMQYQNLQLAPVL